ncbi:glypican-5b isoform X2 [Denticeps clupeoides]|uniref:glypican-5b isoform X2 n=1 Tax=Denticeps clupeoides TaxID=299321 RepID=UPI0010A3659F|nr:glypican-5-like isoform X2 [Denticeps clupeoides]
MLRPTWVLLVLALLGRRPVTAGHSCHEVKTAFQARQVGPAKWVPESAGTDTFRSLLVFTLNHTCTLFHLAYKPIAPEGCMLVSELFSDLALYLHGYANVSAERSVHRFYDRLFPLVFRGLVNPGLSSWSAEGLECLRATRQDVNPFGSHPRGLAAALARALGPGRAQARALAVGLDVLNATEWLGLARECGRAIVRMQFCPHCRGLTLVRPCGGLCLNVMRGCLAGLSELDGPWRRYVATMEEMGAALAGGHELELTLLAIREKINDAILYAQLHGPRLSAIVDKVCGSLTGVVTSDPQHHSSASPATSTRTSSNPEATTATAPPELSTNLQPAHLTHSRRSLPLKSAKTDKPKSLKKITKEFVQYILRYKAFFSTLPEQLCEGEMVVGDHTCWSGEDVVESYSSMVVGNGLQAQEHNPEVKVRRRDPVLEEARIRLEHFNQELSRKMGWNRDRSPEVGSGTSEETSEETSKETSEETSGDCDDEDGCQNSGDQDINSVSRNADHAAPPEGKETRTPYARPTPKATVEGAADISAPRPGTVFVLLLLLHLSV